MGQLPQQELFPQLHSVKLELTSADHSLFIARDVDQKVANMAIFVCFVVKSVHLENVSDLTTHSFPNCLGRFITRHGKFKEIFQIMILISLEHVKNLNHLRISFVHRKLKSKRM